MPQPESLEEWQAEFDATFSEGVRAEYMPEGWNDDPDNIIFFTVRVMVEAVKASLPQMRVTDIHHGNGDHWFQATSALRLDLGWDFDVSRGGRLVLSNRIPPAMKEDIDKVRGFDLDTYKDVDPSPWEASA